MAKAKKGVNVTRYADEAVDYSRAAGDNEQLEPIGRIHGMRQMRLLVRTKTSFRCARVLMVGATVWLSVWTSGARGEDLSAAQPGDTPKRLQVPDSAAERAALTLVRSVFEKEFANATDNTAKCALAKEMLKVASDTKDADERYVLLRVGRDIAAGAGDADTALAAIQQLETSYEVDGVAMRVKAMLKASGARLPVAEQGKLAATILRVVDSAVADDRFEAAEPLLEAALAAARKGKQAELVRRIVLRTKEIKQIQAQFDEARQARSVLQSKPEDPAANLLLGKYLCLVKGDWDRGLPYLALGSDAGLKALAVRELAGPSASDSQIQLADGWWDLAQTDKSAHSQRFGQRAAHWYAKGIGDVPAGLSRMRILKRLQQTGTSEPKQGVALRPEDVRAGALRVLYRCADSNANDNHIKPHLKIANGGKQPVPLRELAIRYWYTGDHGKPQKHWCDWAQLGTGRVQGSFHRVPRPTPTANTYFEIRFADDAPDIPPGEDSGPIQLRVASADWSNYDESNDYSFDPAHTDFAESSRITLYRNGALVWGTEPGRR